ncbi:MAG: Flp pilus assembly protein CpaB [Caulobacter sp.]|nr:Flp pilus assembly protein CpaB [Caulobacter sp.]
MSAVRLFILVIAAIAAIALAFVVRGAFAPKKVAEAPVAAAPAVMAGPRLAKVLVARRDLPIGTRLTAADMSWQDWPADNINAAYITDGAAPQARPTGAAAIAAKKATETAGALFGGAAMQSLVGAVVREPILGGEPIVVRKIVRAGEGNFLSVVLTPGMRAIAFPVTVDTAAGGFIMPGDRVDVLLSRDGGGEKGLITSTVLRNVRVLAIDQAAEPAKDARTMVGAVATLEVAAGDTESVAAAQAEAKKGGALILALRAYTDAGAASGRSQGSTGPGRVVRVYRAGQASEVTVSR